MHIMNMLTALLLFKQQPALALIPDHLHSGLKRGEFPRHQHTTKCRLLPHLQRIKQNTLKNSL